jgi:hypothetical protein
MPVDIPFRRRLLYIIQNRGPVRDSLAVLPWFEVVTERVHVAVRANARKTKEVPGSAHRFAALEDEVGLARTFILQMTGRADARQACTDDYDVKIFIAHSQSLIYGISM